MPHEHGFNLELFAPAPPLRGCEPLAEGALVLRGYALDGMPELLNQLHRLLATTTLRHMTTPGGQRMAVAMSNCGPLGWVSDRRGYCYQATDPLNDTAWPAMPPSFRALAEAAAAVAGYPGFNPDACLVNRYEPGTRLTLHQDRDEHDRRAPIVSVSLGLPAVFLFGGAERRDPTRRVSLGHGDVVVWGGPSRLNYHGVMPIKPGHHPLLGGYRYNLTFRHAS
jgi:alkylated DNA repair protein (DNA oxidative demethylase)